MKVRLLTLSLIFLLTGSSYLLSQGADPLNPMQDKTPIYIGPVVGYNRSLHSVELKTFAEDALCPTFQNGASNGFFAGLSMEYLIGNPATSTSSIIAKVLYNTLPVSLEEGGDEYPSRVIDQSGNELIVNSATDHINEISYDVITLETFYKLDFLELSSTALGVFLGPTFDFAISKEHNQSMNLIKPDNARFARNPDRDDITYTNNDRTIIINEGEIPNSNAFRLGIKAGLQYTITFDKFYIAPHAAYNFGITDLSADEDWRVNAMQFGLDLRYAFSF